MIHLHEASVDLREAIDAPGRTVRVVQGIWDVAPVGREASRRGP